MQQSYAYISKWCVRKAGKAFKQVLMIVILNNRGSICLKERATVTVNDRNDENRKKNNNN